MSRHLWRQSLLLTTAHVFSVLMGLGVFAYAMRHWGPTYSGLMGQAQSLVSALAVVSTLCLDTTLTKYLVQTPDRNGALLGSALGLRLLGSLALALVLAIVALTLGFNSAEQAACISLAYGALAVQSSAIYGFKFSAIANVRPLVATQFVQVLGFSALRIGLIWQGQSIYLFLASFIAEAAFSFFATRWLFHRRFPEIRMAWDLPLARLLLKESFPLLCSSFFVTAFMKIDILIVSALLPLDQVGIYTAAVRIVETYMVAIAVLFGQCLIWLTESHSTPAIYRLRLLRLFRWGALVSLLCLLFNILAGRFLFHWLLGDAYVESVRLSNLLSLTLFATTAGTIRSFAFSLEGLNRYHLWSALTGLLVGIPLTLILTLHFGLYGTGMSMIVAYFLSAIGTSIAFPALRPIGCLQLLIPLSTARQQRSSL